MHRPPESARIHSLGPYTVAFAFGGDDRTAEYRLRFDVFVTECGFESADHCPDGLERDEFDPFSCALLLRDRATGDVAACQRLVLPELLPEGRLTNFAREHRPLPGASDNPIALLPPGSWAEASRTTVAARYRIGATGNGMPGLMALKYASIALAIGLGRSWLFSLSEPVTARLMRKIHFDMEQVGIPVQFHGIRLPFRMNVQAMVRGVEERGDRATLDRLIRAAVHFVEDRLGPGRGPARVA